MNSEIKQLIRSHVIDQYIQTGRHLFISDIAKQFGTNALGVRNALGYDDFLFEKADQWSGDSFSGRYVQSACVEPNKSTLIQIIKQLKGSK